MPFNKITLILTVSIEILIIDLIEASSSVSFWTILYGIPRSLFAMDAFTHNSKCRCGAIKYTKLLWSNTRQRNERCDCRQSS